MNGDGEKRWQDMACHAYVIESKQVVPNKKGPWETADGNSKTCNVHFCLLVWGIKLPTQKLRKSTLLA